MYLSNSFLLSFGFRFSGYNLYHRTRNIYSSCMWVIQQLSKFCPYSSMYIWYLQLGFLIKCVSNFGRHYVSLHCLRKVLTAYWITPLGCFKTLLLLINFLISNLSLLNNVVAHKLRLSFVIWGLSHTHIWHWHIIHDFCL